MITERIDEVVVALLASGFKPTEIQRIQITEVDAIWRRIIDDKELWRIRTGLPGPYPEFPSIVATPVDGIKAMSEGEKAGLRARLMLR